MIEFKSNLETNLHPFAKLPSLKESKGIFHIHFRIAASECYLNHIYKNQNNEGPKKKK